MPVSLITGGAGFIGSHLSEYLLEKGHEVICMDNLITGNIDNIAQIRDVDFSFIKQDVTNYIYIKGELDYIFHLASPASPIDYIQWPIQTLKVGSLGTHKVLGLAKEKTSRVLLASTSEIYGDPLVHPQKEDYWGNVNPIGPRGVYDEAKRFAEAITMAYNRYHKVETRIARIFNTFGERMRINDGRVVPNFMTQAINNEPLTVYGDGKQTRSFCYVSDLVRGLYTLMMSDVDTPVNLGNPEETSVENFADIINKMTGNNAGKIYKSLPVDDPKERKPDIGKARSQLGWEPVVPMMEGLEKTLDYFMKVLKH